MPLALATSPFGPVLDQYGDHLPPALREQYLLPADAPYQLELGGRMHHVWHRPVWLWPVFWLLALGDTFFPETGKNIPAKLTIASGRDASGAPYQIWHRTFYFPKRRQRQYRSKMTYDPGQALIAEWQGPNHMLQEMAQVRFTPPRTLEFLTVKSRVRLGERWITLPHQWWVTAHVVEVAHPQKDDLTDVRLSITHPWLGPVFGYEGTFRCYRRYSTETNA